MSDSILNSTKKALDVPESYDVFDDSIIMHINTAFTTLTQLGIGPVDGYQIENAEATWPDYLGNDKRLNSVKSYMQLRVRLLFDPPANSYLLTSIKDQLNELEWRLNAEKETAATLLVGAKERLVGNFGDEHIFEVTNPVGQTLINDLGTYEATFMGRDRENSETVSLDTTQKSSGVLKLPVTIRSGVYTVRSLNPVRTILTLEVSGQ